MGQAPPPSLKHALSRNTTSIHTYTAQIQGKMKPATAEKTLKDSLARITMTTDLSQLKKCEIVIESVVESVVCLVSLQGLSGFVSTF